MSVHKSKSGKNWVVRYDENGRQRQVTIGPSKKAAEAYDRKIKDLKYQGALYQLDAGKETIEQYASEFWNIHVLRQGDSMQASYATALNRYIIPKLGGYELRQLTAGVIGKFRADIEDEGLGPAGTRKYMACLQKMLEFAVKDEKIPRNNVKLVDKPSDAPDRQISPPTPKTVERIRGRLNDRDATMVALLAYSGIRPKEARRLLWKEIGERTLSIYSTKTSKPRHVRLLPSLRHDLLMWRIRSGNPPDFEYVFLKRDRKPWTAETWRKWQGKIYAPAAVAEGADAEAYDLRHAFISLLIAQHENPLVIAREVGHKPEMTLNRYGHIIAEWEGAPPVPAEERIRQAREKVAVAK